MCWLLGCFTDLDYNGMKAFYLYNLNKFLYSSTYFPIPYYHYFSCCNAELIDFVNQTCATKSKNNDLYKTSTIIPTFFVPLMLMCTKTVWQKGCIGKEKEIPKGNFI